MVGGCRNAEIAPAYGFRSVGGYGIRGWRVFCPCCGYLSELYGNRYGVGHACNEHRNGHTVIPRKGQAV